MARARRLPPNGRRSPVLGDHRSSRARIPGGSRPGTEDHAAIRHEIWDGQQPRERDSRRDAAGADRGPGAPPDARVRDAGQTVRVDARPDLSRGLPGDRDLWPPPRPARRAAGEADGTIVDRDCPCLPPHPVAGGDRTDVAIDVPMPKEPGRYALRFDLVSEGIDWFETCGSEPTVRELVVGT